MPADMFPALLDQKTTVHSKDKKEITTEKKNNENQKELLDEIDLAGLEEWSEDEQKEAKELMTEYRSIFTMSSMDLGKISFVKHSIRLTDNTSFKECYQQIPPCLYEEVREHLKEMLEIGVIWPSHSPWQTQLYLYVRKIVSSNFALI